MKQYPNYTEPEQNEPETSALAFGCVISMFIFIALFFATIELIRRFFRI